MKLNSFAQINNTGALFLNYVMKLNSFAQINNTGALFLNLIIPSVGIPGAWAGLYTRDFPLVVHILGATEE